MTINVFEEEMTIDGIENHQYVIDDPRVDLPHKERYQVIAFIEKHFHPSKG